MSKPLIVVIMVWLSWLPWTADSLGILASGSVKYVNPPCSFRGVYGGGSDTIGICTKTAIEDMPMVILHESQHYLGWHYEALHDVDWKEFELLALDCAERYGTISEARRFAAMNPLELHAQLPWLTNGNLCAGLQEYYPWFDFSPKRHALSGQILR